MRYKTCENCGANLDPCERCDCMDEKNKHSEKEKVSVTMLYRPRREKNNMPYERRRGA
ncbi:hypothetical protein FACS1894111_05970 [Clostridia bacterium]|nr:hypothetical protein FACS1894111_05970 [Clostridia bacterium]